MQLDKSKEWTGGVGLVLEWYDEMMPTGHVASPALRMGQKGACMPKVTTAMSHWHCHFLPKWIRVSVALGQGTFNSWGHAFEGTRMLSTSRYVQKKKIPFSCGAHSIKTTWKSRSKDATAYFEF
ncbi:hypothetical protein XENOCAPTIV_011775 [Xenoophorus captivus]|uniref:Uncharacterized protein n=1 Tax=Xenoophorus captivus TaxID=1517983 RepID=A0ABV0Q9H5_9TELE